MEPLFGIPHTMYTGYMTLYMLELGMTKSQVGMVTSLGLAVHIFFALIGAFVTDKLGRRRTTLIFDTIGWSVAQLVWAFAQNIYFFIAAAIINASFRIVDNSWHCLMLEDSAPESRIHIFTFMQVANILAGFFAPVGAFLINRMTLVPAMRIMLLFSFVCINTLFLIRYRLTTETTIGLRRMQEMRDTRMREVLASYLAALKRIVKNRMLVIALVLRALNFIQLTIRNTFLAVLVTEGLGFPAEAMAMFHTFNAIVMLLALFFVMPLLSRYTRRWPISLGVGFHIVATAILLLSPPVQNYLLLAVSAIFIALGTSIATPRIEALVANTIEDNDRSVSNAVMAIIMLLLSTPFGYIGGVLAEVDTRLPFLLTLALFLVCLLLLGIATHSERREEAAGART